MALFNSYGDFNKKVDYNRSVTYRAEPVSYSNANLEPRVIYWKLTRNSKTKFSHIGMSESAAEACKADLQRKYTRSYMRWNARLTEYENDYPDVSIDMLHVVECGSGIEPHLVEGDNFSVDCQIDETDEIIAFDEPKTLDDFEALFQSAELRDGQDDGKSGISIVSASWNRAAGKITVPFLYEIENFNPSLLGVDVWSGTAWTAETSGVTVSGNVLTFNAADNRKLRLNYDGGRYLSKSYTTTNPIVYNLVIESATFLPVSTKNAGSESFPAYDWDGEGEIRLSVLCEIGLSVENDRFRVRSVIGTTDITEIPRSITYDGYDSSINRYRYTIVVRRKMPTLEQPFKDITITVIPNSMPHTGVSDAVAIDQDDFIQVQETSAVEGPSVWTVTATFRTNLTLAQLSPTVAWGHLNHYIIPTTGAEMLRSEMDHYSVNYESLGDGVFRATFDCAGSWGGFGFLSLTGTNSDGKDFSSVWRKAGI